MHSLMFEDDAVRKLIALEHYLTSHFHISSHDALRINRYVRQRFVAPYAIKRGSNGSGKLVQFPHPPVENSGKSA